MNKYKIEKKKNISENFLKDDRPILLGKKVKKIVAKPYVYIYSDTGQTRHFTPAAQEWYNSIYAYNNNYINLLPIADKNFMNLLKAYFNLRINDNISKAKYIPNRYRRMSAKKIFAGKGELRHTSNKVIITSYIHNIEGKFIYLKLKKLFKSLYYPDNKLKADIFINKEGKYHIYYNRPFTFRDFRKDKYHYEWYLSYFIFILKRFTKYLRKIIRFYNTLTKLVERKLLTNDEKVLLFLKKINTIHTYKYPISFFSYMEKRKELYKANLIRHFYLLFLNKAKFHKIFMKNFISLVKNIYNKNVEFNIVNLKKLHLNSDIFTQAVSLKIRNRDNRLYKVLKSSLSKLKLPKISRMIEKASKSVTKNLVNEIRNNKVTSMFVPGKDSLNDLLLDYYPKSNNLTIEKESGSIKRSISLEKYILENLKHMKIRGIRIEAKGRLTKRLTASRSIFKMKWKGGLKNVDSSFRGLSAIMLRGHVKSNVQYSIVNSKNRIGAFGVKGWVSNK